jgi:hypothetical protein
VEVKQAIAIFSSAKQQSCAAGAATATTAVHTDMASRASTTQTTIRRRFQCWFH